MNKVMMVTGAGRGIGAQIALLAGKSGYDVGVNYQHSKDAAMEIVRQIQASGSRAVAIQGNAGNTEDVTRMFKGLDDFLALTPAGDVTDICKVERACVTQLHSLSAPLPPDELLRRRTAGLSLAKDSMLLRWGYPHVLEHFRFHLSLTGPLRDCSELQIQSILQCARDQFESLPDCMFDSLAIFAEPERGADFVLLEHCKFSG